MRRGATCLRHVNMGFIPDGGENLNLNDAKVRPQSYDP